MAEKTEKSLGDFFAKKKTKKIKALNLNTQPVQNQNEGDVADKDKKKKEQDKEKKEGDWVEEKEESQAGPKSELGQLARDYEEEEQVKPAAKAWGAAPVSSSTGGKGSSHRKGGGVRDYPSLQASSAGLPIASQKQEVVLVSQKKKNAFAGLEDSDDEENKSSRPRQGLARKKQGEAMVPLGKGPAVELTKEEIERREEQKRKKEEKKEIKNELKAQRLETSEPGGSVQKNEEEDAPDVLMEMDTDGTRNKFVGRRKLSKTQLPSSELKAEPKQVSRKKLKVKQIDQEKEKKILTIQSIEEVDAW